MSIFLALHLLALLALAACPDLHHAVHADSGCPDHHCLVTMLAQGQVTGAELEVILVCGAVFFICAARLPKAPPQLAFHYRYSPSRAPPQF